VKDALDWLGRLEDTVGGGRLTGTGACCFAELADPRVGLAALERLPPGLDGFVARGLNRSPLLDRLSREP
jgi:4-diphosphocytidyl-2-C-methyl-D-erythritol kinase